MQYGISNLNIDILKKTLNKDIVIKKIWNPIQITNECNIVNIEKNKYYLYVGRVAKEKGIEVFCKEMQNSKRKCVVVGDGPELGRLREEYPNIEFTGWKNSEEVVKYMQNARLLVLPSLWYEGAPLTPLEGMQYGIPCIISKYCSAIEYIENENGLVFDPLKKGDLLEKISIVESKLEEYSNNAYKYVKKIDNNHKYLNELEEFYEKMR